MRGIMQKLLKDLTIRRWDDCSFDQLTHRIILKIVRFLERPLRSCSQCMLLQKVFHPIMAW